MIRGKKGAINLSINMIIVLIIAIIILGFALSFITGMLRKAEIGLSGQFPEPEVSVSAQNPIGIGDNFLIRPGETRRVSLRVFNTGDAGIDTSDTSNTALTTSCSSGTPPEVTDYDKTVTIPAGETGVIRAVIQGRNNMENNAICTISVGSITQSFFLDTR